ncbi:MAG: GntR family transcriptional regulator [Sedimentibacter sp.]
MEQKKYVQKKSSLSQKAYLELRNDIYRNKIKPGDCLSENLIASELNMSRTPVREALRILENEDLVEIKDGIGIYVKTILLSDIEDIFEVRKVLEALAFKTSMNRITDEEITNLEEKFKKLMLDFNNGIDVPMDSFVSVDWELDELIVNKCKNNYIISIMNDIKAKIIRYQYMSYEALNDVVESTSQHLRILSLIRERNLKELIDANGKHIDWSLSCFVRNK